MQILSQAPELTHNGNNIITNNDIQMTGSSKFSFKVGTCFETQDKKTSPKQQGIQSKEKQIQTINKNDRIKNNNVNRNDYIEITKNEITR